MTANSFSAAASNNPVYAGQINQFLVDHNVGLYAYDGSVSLSNTTVPTSSFNTNTGGTTGLPQMVAQAFTVGGSPLALTRLQLMVAATRGTAGCSGSDTIVSIQTDNSGVPSGTIVCSAYLPASWLTTTAQVISLPMTATLSATTKYWIVIGSSTIADNYLVISSGGVSVVALTSTNGGTSWSAGATELWFALNSGTDGMLRGIQADAGGRQVSIVNGMCRLDAAMNALTLPQATIKVTDGTQAFPASGTFYLLNNANNQQTITYTGRTASTFTGCTGGAGTLATGGLCYVAGGLQPTNLYDFTAYQSSVLGNILVPPDDNFATGTGTWAPISNLTVGTSTAAALFGLQCGLITSTSGSAMSGQTYLYACTAALSYAFQAWVLAATTSLRNVNMAVAWFNAAGAQVGSTILGSAVATSQTVWANPKLVATAPAGAVNAQVIIQWGSGTNGDTYYVNGVGMNQAAAVPAWSPGGLGIGQARTLTYSSGRLVSMA